MAIRNVSNVSNTLLFGMIYYVYIVWFWGPTIVIITRCCIVPIDLTSLIFLMLPIEIGPVFGKYLILVKFTIEIILRSGGNESTIQIIILNLGNIVLIAAYDFS